MRVTVHAAPVARDAADCTAGAVVVGMDGAGVRRRVGPVPWCVLEAIVAASDGRGVASVSVRSLATESRLSKNTVQRAVATLRAAGLVEPIGQRRDDGRYGVGGYRITVARSVLAPVDAPLAVPSRAEAVEDRRPSRRPRRVVRPVVVEQLSLLPEA